MHKGLIVTTDNETTIVEFDKDNALKTFQTAVGGLVQVLSFKDDLEMYANEEGKIEGLPVNILATRVWIEFYGATDIIMGNVIFTGGVDDEGYTLGLTDERIEFLQKRVRNVASRVAQRPAQE